MSDIPTPHSWHTHYLSSCMSLLHTPHSDSKTLLCRTNSSSQSNSHIICQHLFSSWCSHIHIILLTQLYSCRGCQGREYTCRDYPMHSTHTQKLYTHHYILYNSLGGSRHLLHKHISPLVELQLGPCTGHKFQNKIPHLH